MPDEIDNALKAVYSSSDCGIAGVHEILVTAYLTALISGGSGLPQNLVCLFILPELLDELDTIDVGYGFFRAG